MCVYDPYRVSSSIHNLKLNMIRLNIVQLIGWRDKQINCWRRFNLSNKLLITIENESEKIIILIL